MAGSLCLLLTATIRVDHPEFLRPGGRVDTQVRLGDYTAALEAWMTRQHSVRDIVFFDNSGHSLDALREVAERHRHAGKRVELISHHTTGYSAVRGRSYGELDIIHTALQRSALLKEANHVAKVTGRVFIPNFDAIVTALAPDFDIVGRLSHNLTWLETVFVLARRSVLAERLLPFAREHVDDHARLPIERVMARACLHSIADGCRWYPFAAEPRLQGTRGLDNRPYPSSRLRARIMDFFAWGHHRALDVSSSAAVPHPLGRWPVRPAHAGDADSPERGSAGTANR